MPDLRMVVEQFIAGAREPVVLDPGEEPLRLIHEQWTLREWNGRLILEAWDGSRNLVRRIVKLESQHADRISLVTERFPKSQAETQIADLAAPRGEELHRRSSRRAFRDRFRLMLRREFPGWQVAEVSADANLEQSLSPAYVRAFLRLGNSGMAAMAVPAGAFDAAGVVTYGLIWLDYLRRRERNPAIARLLLYVPVGQEREVGWRAAQLNVECHLYVFDAQDYAGEIDFDDAGNVESVLPPCRHPLDPNCAVPELPDYPGVDKVLQGDGSLSLRVRGLEFARASGGVVMAGLGRRSLCPVERLHSLAKEIERIRRPGEDPLHPLYAQYPEGWLEAQVRAHPEAIDASIRRAPLYGQVPIFHGAQRGVIDLLGVDDTGRLVVMELKATADPHLPLQALDYWLRVRKHLAAGDFERFGYFPGIAIRREDPKIVLVAPSLEFHSTSETILSFLSPKIEFVRIGLGAGWREELKVMFRLRGAERPQ